jgi:lantibiotic biosynthesis dehydratase-like protein
MTSSAAMHVGDFSPYVLYRRGTLGLAQLGGLLPRRTWELLDAASASTRAQAELRFRIEDALYRIIPAMPPRQRRALLRLRRDVHNGRLSEPLLGVDDLPQPCWDMIDRWMSAGAEQQELIATASFTFVAELDEARKALADIARNESLQRGIQLSGEDAYREVMSYAADPFDRARKPSRRRRAESTITSYAYRVALKPSPFGAFTEIGAQQWTPSPAGPGKQIAQARISIGLLAWMIYQLRRIGGAEDLMQLRLNNSLLVRGEHVTFVRRPIEGAEEAMVADKVITARNTDLVRLLCDALREGSVTERQLQRRLVDAGLAVEKAAATIDQLVKVGLCHRGLGLPDHTTRVALQAANRLRELGTPQALRCAEIFDRTQHIEDSFASSDAGQRTYLLGELRGLVHRLAQECGSLPPSANALRSIMFEDIGTSQPAISWQPSLVEYNADNLDLFQRILPVLDDATIEKLSLYHFFVERFGESAEVAAIDLYAQFTALSPTAAGKLMSGIDDPHCAQVRDLRAEFFHLLRAQLFATTDREELALAPDHLRAFTARIPACAAPWRSAAYRLQFADIAGRPRIVVNGVTTGYGVFFSRFCDLLSMTDASGRDLGESIAANIRSTSPRQTDITATLGLNFNLHPPLSPYDLVYPGSVPREGAQHVLTLADLVVRPDPATRRLHLVSRMDGQAIDLVPLNFLYPAAAPMLYRFLCAFAPTRTYRGGLAEQLDRQTRRIATGELPRMTLGDLVLDRRSWRFSLAELPDMVGLEYHDLLAIREFDHWRTKSGLPRHTFFRVYPDRGRAAGARDLLAETHQWALEARSARRHKPHYLDARNPFLLAVLARHATSTQRGWLAFHECLPAIETYGAESRLTSAEEFFIEYTLQRGSTP